MVDSETGKSDMGDDLRASRKSATRWQPILLGAVAVVLGVALVLVLFVGWQWYEAVMARQIAQSRELAAHAITQLTVDPELSVLLAIEAVQVKPSAQAENALIQSLFESKVRAVMRGHTGWVYRAAFSPDGKFVVTASNDNTARIWDAATGARVVELRGHTAPVVSAVFSPDAKSIVTASWDDTARIWDASTGAQLAELRGHTSSVLSALFSPDGKFIVTASADGTARIWDASTGKSLAELRGHTIDVKKTNQKIATCWKRKTDVSRRGK